MGSLGAQVGLLVVLQGVGVDPGDRAVAGIADDAGAEIHGVQAGVRMPVDERRVVRRRLPGRAQVTGDHPGQRLHTAVPAAVIGHEEIVAVKLHKARKVDHAVGRLQPNIRLRRADHHLARSVAVRRLLDHRLHPIPKAAHHAATCIVGAGVFKRTANPAALVGQASLGTARRNPSFLRRDTDVTPFVIPREGGNPAAGSRIRRKLARTARRPCGQLGSGGVARWPMLRAAWEPPTAHARTAQPVIPCTPTCHSERSEESQT